MHNPLSTYRIQFHKEFSFKEFERIIPYLQQLGVKTLYASPIFEATPGSNHGYDVTNPHRINPEVGTEKQLKAISKQLQAQDISWLQDIVPNHMAYVPQNAWLMDVLEKGQLSMYAPFFDIAWNSKLFHGRMMVPFLGAPLEEVLQNGELSVVYQQQRLMLKYYDNLFPLHLRSYATLLSTGEKAPEAVQQLLKQVPQIQRLDTPGVYAPRLSEFVLQLASLMKEPDTKNWIKARLKEVNSDQKLLQQIADEQSYRLCYWKETEHQINFRRFFTVNSLICLNVQDEQVFTHYHQYIKKLLEQGVFQGLRIDHVDGLYDPSGYMERLRELVGDDTYITVEKILEPGEELPTRWPIQGNTGYDFLSMVNNLFTNAKSERIFTRHYKQLSGNTTPVHDQILEKKKFILYHRMAGELENLYQLFLELNLADKKSLKELPDGTLKAAIGEFLIQCPVYRYYGNNFPLGDTEATAVAAILQHIRQEKKELTAAADLLEEALLQKPPQGDASYNQRALRFYQRSMQFTGPLMAKGVEDTLMYTYNRFVAHNEVGDSPEVFELSAKEFHQKMLERQQQWPLSINATSTHDTKRGEDVRARLHVLTDLPDEWLQQVQEWQQTNWGLKQNSAPDANDEYLIYQTLVGAYPMPQQDEDNFPERLQAYLQKALREAKQHSNWSEPNEQYEEATKNFATRLLDKDRAFWTAFQQFHRHVADYGIVNSLSQVLLKFTCPGLPDVYQGTELWDLSLVDPDNRRPVNYEQRQQWLNEIINTKKEEYGTLLHSLWNTRYSGQIKLWLIYKLFQERKQQAELFEKGQYIPLQVAGKHREHVFAFARRYQQQWYVVAIPLHLASLSKQQQKDILDIDWKDTHLVLPPEAPAEWSQLLEHTNGKAGDNSIAVSEIFQHLPLAVLKLQQPVKDRSAGILMHITSLPSPFGMGDFGPEAKAFADFLARSKQTYWQLLPLNPTELGTGHSPYSSYSSMAGNTLLLSPELLAEEGLLEKESLQQYHLPTSDRAAFEEAEHNKNELLEQAYQNYKEGTFSRLKRQFQQFCEQEADWLNDFALYLVLKQEHQGKAWFQWPENYKQRQQKALQQFEKQHADAIEKVKWLQFLFSKQWKELKEYCQGQGIKFFGDLPFYVSYDSVDVWANPEIFALDEEGKMTGVAGVPPDYFNADGQLWGMPVFKWEVLKEQKYGWWVRRIRKNMELYDVLRLDHFRAFADYWEVPAGEETAKNGRWKQGPGILFFKTLSKELGKLPFIAEDLGDINDAVYELRDKLALPGMKVLQFAFGGDMPRSVYIPHNYTPNYVAYTGTHDNNTTRGWYRQDLSKEDRSRMEAYLGSIVLEKEVHAVLGRLAYASVAKTAVLPLQDILGLDESARMNMPASIENNWLWRLQPGQLTSKHEDLLREWCQVYHRG